MNDWLTTECFGELWGFAGGPLIFIQNLKGGIKIQLSHLKLTLTISPVKKGILFLVRIPKDGRRSVGPTYMSTDCRSTVDRLSTECRWSVGRLSIDSRPSGDRVSIEYRSSVDRYDDRYGWRHYLQ